MKESHSPRSENWVSCANIHETSAANASANFDVLVDEARSFVKSPCPAKKAWLRRLSKRSLETLASLFSKLLDAGAFSR